MFVKNESSVCQMIFNTVYFFLIENFYHLKIIAHILTSLLYHLFAYLLVEVENPEKLEDK